MTDDNRTRVQKLVAAVKRGQERRQLTAEEKALTDAMRARVEAKDAGPEMVDVRYQRETDIEKSQKLVAALEYALHLAAPKESENLYAHGWKLPAYLENALLRFNESISRAADLAMVKNAVNAAHAAGASLNRAPAQGIEKTAFDIAAEQLCMTPLMIESIYYGRTPNNQPFPQKAKTTKK